MLYLATPSSPEIRAAMSSGAIGCMTSPRQGNRIPAGAAWAADNGRFSARGWPGTTAWLGWLARNADRRADTCLFALAPDTPGDWGATLAESRPLLAYIRHLGLPAALAAQDGCVPGDLPYGEFDTLFIAGSTRWKTGRDAQRLILDAVEHDVAVHMGRVNSRRRLGLASWFGCSSADGTFLTFGPNTNLPRLLQWLSDLDREPFLHP